ncbi:hypothetical protein [Lactobacillus crispatus]|uniref:hypothetical protein n=1 Tax=Lactobacillus crispatus TaxID=47770 RepID=UPI001E38AAC5|nr:hypothetical protein [Lactobacillus crispatus]
MLVSKNLVKVVSIAVASMSLMGVGASVSQAASFTAPKLGVAETMPTDPAIKKGDKIFVAVKDTKNQKVNVLDAQGHKTSPMGSTYTAKDVKKAAGKKIVKINKSQWLNTKDVVKD